MWGDLSKKIEESNIEFKPNPLFSGPNGLFFIELQKSYGKDPRFVLDERFIGDIDVSKLPKDIQANF